MSMHRGPVEFPLRVEEFVYTRDEGERQPGGPRKGVRLIDSRDHVLYQDHHSPQTRKIAQRLQEQLEEGKVCLQAHLPSTPQIPPFAQRIKRTIWAIALGMLVVAATLLAIEVNLMSAIFSFVAGMMLIHGSGIAQKARQERLGKSQAHPPYRLQGQMRVEGDTSEGHIPNVACQISIKDDLEETVGVFRHTVDPDKREAEEMSRVVDCVREARQARKQLPQKKATRQLSTSLLSDS